MGLFRRKTQVTPQPIQEPITFQDCLAPYVLEVYIHQLRFGEVVVKQQDWACDLGQRTISFDNDVYPTQLLGSQSYVDNTWLWGWANTANYGEAVLQDALAMKALGESNHIPELKEAMSPLTTAPYAEEAGIFDGHTIATATIGQLHKKACYYSGDYGNGAAILLVEKIPDEVFKPILAQEAISALSQVISLYPLAHKQVVKGFMDHEMKLQEEHELMLIALDYAGTKLMVQFDELGRISSMKTE